MRAALLCLLLAAGPTLAQGLGGSDGGRNAGAADQGNASNNFGHGSEAPAATSFCEIAANRGDTITLLAGDWTARVLPGVLILNGETQRSDPLDGIAIFLDPERRTARFEGEALSSRLMSRRSPLLLEEGQAYVALDEARKQAPRPPCEDLDLPRLRAEGRVVVGEQSMDVLLYLEAVGPTELVGVVQLIVSTAGSDQSSLAVHAIVANR